VEHSIRDFSAEFRGAGTAGLSIMVAGLLGLIILRAARAAGSRGELTGPGSVERYRGVADLARWGEPDNSCRSGPRLLAITRERVNSWPPVSAISREKASSRSELGCQPDNSKLNFWRALISLPGSLSVERRCLADSRRSASGGLKSFKIAMILSRLRAVFFLDRVLCTRTGGRQGSGYRRASNGVEVPRHHRSARPGGTGFVAGKVSCGTGKVRRHR